MTDAALSPTARARSLIAVIVAMGVTSMIYSASLPLFATLLDGMGHAEDAIGINTMAQSISVLAVAPLTPRLLERLGPAWLMLAMLAITLAVFLVCPLTQNHWAWFGLRLIMGAATGVLWIAGEVWINEVADDARRGKVIAFYGIAGAVGTAAGPLALRLTGVEGFAPFLAICGLILVSVVPIAMAISVAPRIVGGLSVRLDRFFTLAPMPMLLNLAVSSTFGALWAFFTVYGSDIGVPVDDAFMLLMFVAAGGALLQYPIGWLADRVDRVLLVLGMVILILALVTFMTPAVTDPVWRWPYTFALGGVLMGLYAMGLVIVGARFRGTDLGTATTVFQVMWNVGMVAGPLAVGFAMKEAGPAGLPWSLFAFYALFLPVVVGSLLRRRRQ